MINSKAKGARIELQVRDELRKLTELPWERIPSSGALGKQHGLKGDLYIPKYENNFCVEVKGRAESVFNHSILSSVNSELQKFWDQANRQAHQTDQIPLVIFKWDRSRLYILFDEYALSIKQEIFLTMPKDTYRWLYYNKGKFYIAELSEFIKNEELQWTA